jgi:hypothetical protein
MRKLFEISSEERKRILEMHESATKRNYLTEEEPKVKIIPSVEPNEFGLTNKNASKFMELARASTQFIFNGAYYVLSYRGSQPKEPMSWGDESITWSVYGIGLQGYPYIQQFGSVNTLSVYNVEGARGDVNGNWYAKSNIKFKNPKKEFAGVNEIAQYLGGPIQALNYFVIMLNSTYGNGEALNLTKFAPLIETMSAQPNYNEAFKKLWLPTLTPNSMVTESEIKDIQNSWFYKTWLKNKYGTQPTEAQPTGAQPTGAQPAR